MKRVVFIIVVVAACAIFKSVINKQPSGVTISTVTGVQYAGGTCQATVASRGGRAEQIVFSSPGANFTLRESGMNYNLNYADRGFGGQTSLREERLSFPVCVFDQDRGVRSVTYSGSVNDLGEKIRKREKLDIAF